MKKKLRVALGQFNQLTDEQAKFAKQLGFDSIQLPIYWRCFSYSIRARSSAIEFLSSVKTDIREAVRKSGYLEEACIPLVILSSKSEGTTQP